MLDCCYAGAFRGADLADAVAGPGRYVLTSCRGTQLANDATIENGTSLVVDGSVLVVYQLIPRRFKESSCKVFG